jgi:hypothetical protein
MMRLAHENFMQLGGWKIHLVVAEDNYQLVHDWLFENQPYGYKHLKGGEKQQKDFTIYVGHRDAARDLAEQIQEGIGDKLIEPSDASGEGAEVRADDIRLSSRAPAVFARFDVASNDDLGRHFHGYGVPGHQALLSQRETLSILEWSLQDRQGRPRRHSQVGEHGYRRGLHRRTIYGRQASNAATDGQKVIG